jgi:hypothetical protein
MGEKWIDFVKRIHSEGQKKDPNHSFKQAMSEASERKSEWKKDSSSSSSEKKTKTTTKKMGKKGGKKRKGTKKRRTGRKIKN